MLYIIVAVLFVGNCAIEITAYGLKVKFIPTGKDPLTVAEVDMEVDSLSVKPNATGKTVGYVRYCLMVEMNFPGFNVEKPLKDQGTFSGTLNGKPLKNFTVTERVWQREAGSSGELATLYIESTGKTLGYYQDLQSTEPLSNSLYYFEAD